MLFWSQNSWLICNLAFLQSGTLLISHTDVALHIFWKFLIIIPTKELYNGIYFWILFFSVIIYTLKFDWFILSFFIFWFQVFASLKESLQVPHCLINEMKDVNHIFAYFLPWNLREGSWYLWAHILTSCDCAIFWNQRTCHFVFLESMWPKSQLPFYPDITMNMGPK